MNFHSEKHFAMASKAPNRVTQVKRKLDMNETDGFQSGSKKKSVNTAVEITECVSASKQQNSKFVNKEKKSLKGRGKGKSLSSGHSIVKNTGSQEISHEIQVGNNNSNRVYNKDSGEPRLRAAAKMTWLI